MTSLYASPDSPIAGAKKPKQTTRSHDSTTPTGRTSVKSSSSLVQKPAAATEPVKTGGMLNTFRNALFSPVLTKKEEEERDAQLKLEALAVANAESRGTPTNGAATTPRGTSKLPSINSPNGVSARQGTSSSTAGTTSSSASVPAPINSPGKPSAAQQSASARAAAAAAAQQQQIQQQQQLARQQQQQLEEEEDDEEVFNPYQFIYMLPPHPYVKIANKIVLGPMQNPKHNITLVLDLDETLVHCSVEPIPRPDKIFPVLFNGVNYQVHVRKRPFVDMFLEAVADHYEVVLFTASQKVYADKLLDYIDPEKKYIRHRLFRDSCLNVQGNYIKDLEVLGRNLATTVLVDNSPYAYAYQVDNGIPIESWYDDDSDQELLKLAAFLKNKVKDCTDVRPIVREQFKTFKLVEDAKRGVSLKHMTIPGFP